MGAGVDDGVLDLVGRQVGIVRGAIEGELRDQHARQAKLPAQRMHLRRDRAEVLRQEWLPAAGVAQRAQQFSARRRSPAALPGGARARRNLPVGLQRAEVIDAQVVEAPELRR